MFNKCEGGYTVGEMISVCIARSARPGDVLGQGIGCPLVAAGYMLAKRLYAPDATISYTAGNSYSIKTFPLNISYLEKYTIGEAMHLWDFTEATSVIVPSRKITLEFFRPAQVDAYGNTNNVVIGDFTEPTVRLPGCGGIADATTIWPRVELYVPRHSMQVMRGKIDFISGLGTRGNESGKAGPWRVVSDLGIMGFDEETGRMRIDSVHPGKTVEEIRQNTGFELLVSDSLQQTSPPTDEELRLLRDEIDPLGVSRLETISSGTERNRVIYEILVREREMHLRGDL